MLKLCQKISRHFKTSSRLLNNIEVFVDGTPVSVAPDYSILQACQKAGVVVPHFCFHERLAVSGNCRMCIVEIEKMPKVMTACSMPVSPGMRINTKSEKTYNARGGVMEFLLANHPLDCPICDQGGECDLQDQSALYGYKIGRFMEYKRAVEDKNYGPLVATVMTRCIHCTRCIRFYEEVAGIPILGTTGRGRETEVGTYVEKMVHSELSGNLVDLCPVGALTNAPYAFTARPWELRNVMSIDPTDSITPSIEISCKGGEVKRVLPRLHEEVNEEWIHDRSRHAFDGLKRQRLNACLKKKADGSYEELTWKDALEVLAEEVSKTSGNDMVGIIGEFMDVEAVVAFRDLMYKLGCENIDAKKNGVKLSPDFRNNYLMNSRISGIEEADLLLVIGANLRLDSPVINARVRKATVLNGLNVGLIGTDDYLTYDHTHLGTSTSALTDLLKGTHPFAKTLEKAKFPMILVGANVLKREDGEAVNSVIQEIAKKYNVIKPESNWNGYNVLHNEVGTVAALEVGITSEYDPKAKPKFMYLLGADNFKPDEIPDDAFVVYQGTHGDEGASRANLILPGASYVEKSGSYVNTDGRVSLGKKAIPAPGQAKADWEILRALSEVLGQTLPYDNLQEIRYRIAELAPHLIKYDYVEPYSLSWHTVPVKGEVNKTVISDFIDNFYMTDAISRASPTMAKCSEAFNPARNTNFVPEVPIR
ncbi:unnamed protein product [Blepharisma stoltei]|uniref:NADH-ubiquinone oxidoreductase 75 kDa subunit, mitochondrial n=1 Tax=Blepharisma stoltei TaxID=1481888 RepID=A0AAU9J560_9CILI|nr:unnamed protein product [Blepharisma stoltei]